MALSVIKCTPEKWANYSQVAHKAVFGEIRDPQLDRISYAMLVHNDNHPIGFTTCREIDSESLYWQYGGCFKGNVGVPSFRAFEAVFNDSKSTFIPETTIPTTSAATSTTSSTKSIQRQEITKTFEKMSKSKLNGIDPIVIYN